MLLLLTRALLCAALAVSATAFLWTHQHLRPGWGRMAVALPALVALQLPPLLFDPHTEALAVVLSINFPWLAASSVLSWAGGRGPYAQPFPHFLAFLAFFLCPALPSRPLTEHAAGAHRLHKFGLLDPAAKLAGLAASVAAFDCLAGPPWLLGILQALALFWFTSLALEFAATLASLLSGMAVLPPFDRPYLSASVSEFWGRRWNRVAGTKFRTLVYDPICLGLFASGWQQLASGQHGGTGSRLGTASVAPWRRIVGMCATFAVSGAVHELAFFHLTRRLSGRWMLFFTIQGPLLLVEAWLRRLCRQACISLPLAVRIANTTVILHLCAQMLFFPDLVAAGVPRRLLHQLLPGGMCGGDGAVAG